MGRAVLETLLIPPVLAVYLLTTMFFSSLSVNESGKGDYPAKVWVLLAFHQSPVSVFVAGCSGQLGYRQQLYKGWPPQWLYGGCPSPAPHIICKGPNLSLEEEAGHEGPSASLILLISLGWGEGGWYSCKPAQSYTQKNKFGSQGPALS